jgi:SAM-dependent methyltransferase
MDVNTEVRTWHHGLVARWWAEFNEGGDDVEPFRRAIAASGEPALDVACGTGRLLVPLRRAGVDVDGSDVSADMLEWCRRAAEAEGLCVSLYRQPMHALNVPRRYRTVFVCGAFGLGGTRRDDLAGLRRIREHLEPGGTLVMDYDLPNHEMARGWSSWVKEPELPQPWPKRVDRRIARDGTELELCSRVLAFDPLEQTLTREMRARHYVDGREVATETNAIDINIYFKSEIELMLEASGFRDIVVTAFGEDRPALAWHDGRILFRARNV